MSHESAPDAAQSDASPSRFDRALPFVVGGSLVLLAAVFWSVNGANVFTELVSAAWALCF